MVNHTATNADSYISYYDYGGTLMNPTTTRINYLGVVYNITGGWGLSYIGLNKEIFANALSFKTGTGIAWGYGYSEGEETAAIDWTHIDSVSLSFTTH